ncbi:DNA replication/repair protein RecF [Psychromonas sp. CD1]|uniref:DNA replication/repair protein RecF n=1 Tax=Psychromonas sp. CD1 TaxID=1979839 RepID=UPI000B9A97A7|nr:DNA replication/repair protein RecF [Psychromonas sp. CD1]
MPISKLIIHDFRNIQRAHLHFNKKINVITGLNGSGKTALLEAIYFLGLGRSFRSHLTNRIIAHEEVEFILFAEIEHQNLQTSIGLKKTRKGQSVLKINSCITTKLSALTLYLPIQLITPESISLLSGSPQNRRSFIDWGVFYHDPQFYKTWARIKRLLKQRNAALKQCKTYNELRLWDNELCFLSTEISEQRQRYFQQLTPLIENTIADFLPEFKIKMSFFCGWDNKNKSLQQYFIDNFNRDKQLGYTTAGPQKADVRFKIGAYPLVDVLSRGQLKLFVYALRLAQCLFLNKVNKKQCVLLIDDFSSELDKSKQQILAKHITQSDAQLFISVIQENHIEQLFEQKYSVFHVKHGKITNTDSTN